MQEQQCFPLCLSCSFRKSRLKDSILQHNLFFYINIKRNMNPEGLQTSTAKWQFPVKVNVLFSFQSSINSRLPIISFTAEQQTSVYWTWAFPVYLIYLLIIHADREISFPFIESSEDIKSSCRGKRGMHLRVKHFGSFTNPMAPVILLLKRLARGIFDFLEECILGVWHWAFDPTCLASAWPAMVCCNQPATNSAFSVLTAHWLGPPASWGLGCCVTCTGSY